MTEQRRDVDELGARLSEIDRRLAEIQAELVAPEAVFQADLLSSLRDVLAGFERALHALAGPGTVSISAGPFSSLEEVRRFERELATLPGVDRAAVRGYEGADRVMIDVELARPERG